jgi:hypothetical protein
MPQQREAVKLRWSGPTGLLPAYGIEGRRDSGMMLPADTEAFLIVFEFETASGRPLSIRGKTAESIARDARLIGP